MSRKLKERFIAGAVCPQCKQIDKIKLCIEEHDERIECVNCGYQETKSETLQNNAKAKVKEQTIKWYSSQSKQPKNT